MKKNNNNSSIQFTAEHVSDGHPDKFCDGVADSILDQSLGNCANESDRKAIRNAIECLVKDNCLFISGEVSWPKSVESSIDVTEIARERWRATGYGDGDELTVIDHLRAQSPDIASGGHEEGGVDQGGAGDQGIMVGYATNETPEMMPNEWVLARNLCLLLREKRRNGSLPWLRSDTKSQVTVDSDLNPLSYIIAAQHSPEIGLSDLREAIYEDVIKPVLGDQIPFTPKKINGTGKFVIGGPTGDAGVVGRKIVVDQFGPRVPVGGWGVLRQGIPAKSIAAPPTWPATSRKQWFPTR